MEKKRKENRGCLLSDLDDMMMARKKKIYCLENLNRGCSLLKDLLDVAIANSYILVKYHTTNGSKVKIKNFRTDLAKQLIGNYCSRRRRGRKSASSIRPLPLRHFPAKVDDDINPGKRRRGNCAYCRQAKKKRMNTSWFCRECSEWLCHSGDRDDCFLQWHTHLDVN